MTAQGQRIVFHFSYSTNNGKVKKKPTKKNHLNWFIGVENKVEQKHAHFDSLLDLQKFMLAQSVKETEKLKSQ